MNLIGGRKMALGLVYLILGYACVFLAVFKGADAGVIASVAGACVSLATGMGVVVWGNVRVHEAQADVGVNKP